MKYIILFLALITLVTALVACKRSSTQVSPQNAGLVVFPAPGVSLDVGADWKRVDADPGLPVCPPTLVGPAGMVRAMLFDPNVSNMQAATNSVRSMFDDDSDAVKDSYQQEGFTTASGLHGQQISYMERIKKDGSVTEMWYHRFVVQRHDGRCVTISYIDPALVRAESDGVRQMIQKSLKLE